MKHNDCFDDKDCDPIIVGACCDPKTVCPSNSQLIELEKLLIALSTAIPTFLTTPNPANKAALVILFNQLLALLDSLIPTAEVDYLKQLIESIKVVLNAPILKLGQLIVLLQQFYSALADYFFSIKTCFAPSTLRFLFQLLTNLIIVTSGTTSGGGAVIPYASGVPVALVTLANGLASTGSVVGFGSSLPGIGLVGNNINLVLGDFAFVAPRAGTITSLAGFFSVTTAITLPLGQTANVGVKLQIFTAPGSSTTFVPQTPPLLLPLLTTPLAIGNSVDGIQDLNIPVNAGDKILLYVTADTTFTAVTTVLGFVSAGITID